MTALVQACGYNVGDHAVRTYKPCPDCDWQELRNGLPQRRWYATSQILLDGCLIIVGGRRQFNYEFYSKISVVDGSHNLPFLAQTNDALLQNNLYPFVFLNFDGNLFIFSNNRIIMFNHTSLRVTQTYPTIPGGDSRNYPNTGSTVLLSLRSNAAAEVMVCSGAPKGAFLRANKGDFVKALNTCGRTQINDPGPQWVMETMSSCRVMGEMLLLPDGNILIINNAGTGTTGNWVGALICR